MHRATRLQLAELNPLFSCILCGGYLVDATTVIECLHSFCRACIVRYLESNKFCPVCEVQVHKTKPLLSIRSDKTLQNIVYKLVPGLYQNEMKRRREIYENHPDDVSRCNSVEHGTEVNESCIYSPEENISLSLEYAAGTGDEVKSLEDKSKVDESSEDGGQQANVSQRRYLQCPAAITIGHLKKFIAKKYDLPCVYRVEMMHSNEVLGDEYSLMDVAYIFSWKRSGPMRFFYTFTSQSAKKQKTSHLSQDSMTPSVATVEMAKTEEPSEPQTLSRTIKPKRHAKRSKLKGRAKPYKRINSEICNKMKSPLLLKHHTPNLSSKICNNGPSDSASELPKIGSSNDSSSQDVCLKLQCASKDNVSNDAHMICSTSISSCTSQDVVTTAIVMVPSSNQTCSAISLSTDTVSSVKCSSDVSMMDIACTSCAELPSSGIITSCTSKPATSPLVSSIYTPSSISVGTPMSSTSTPLCTSSFSNAPSNCVPNDVLNSSPNGFGSSSLPLTTCGPSSQSINSDSALASATSNGLSLSPKFIGSSFPIVSQSVAVNSVSSPGPEKNTSSASNNAIVTVKNSLALTNTSTTTQSLAAHSSPSPIMQSSLGSVVHTCPNPAVQPSLGPAVHSSPSPAVRSSPSPAVRSSPSPAVRSSPSPTVLLSSGPSMRSSISSTVRPTQSCAMRSSQSPSRKSSTSHLKPIQSSTFVSNPTLKFRLAPSCSPNHVGSATLNPAVIPSVDSSSNIMLISTTRSTSSASSNVVSSVPGLIVCPSQNIAVCSPPNIALIPSQGHGIRLTSQPTIRGNRRGRPPTRHNRGILPRTSKASTHLLANGPVARHVVGPTPRLINGSPSQRSVGAPFSTISPTPSFVVCSIPGVTVQPRESCSNISMSTSSIVPVSSASKTVLSSLPCTSITTKSSTANTVNFQSHSKPVNKTENESPPKSKIVDLPAVDHVPNGLSTPSPQTVLDEKDKLKPLCTESQITNDTELPASDNSSSCLSPVNVSKSKDMPSGEEKPGPVESKEPLPELPTVLNSSPIGKKESITLKISVKNSTYHADFSDNDDLGCQPDLIVDEQKMDSSDEGEAETDYVLKEKIKAIAEKDDEVDDADSGRASDISNQARSSCDDDVGSPTSATRSPDIEPTVSVSSSAPATSGSSVPVTASSPLQTSVSVKDIRVHSKPNGIAHIVDNLHRSLEPKKDDIGALDLSFCYGRKPEIDKSPWPRPRTVANPPVLDMKHRLPTCLTAPTKPHTACAPAPKNNSHSISQRGPVPSPSPSSHSTIPVSRHSATPVQSKSRHVMASPVSPSHHRIVTGTPTAHQVNIATSPHNIASMLHRQVSSPHNRLMPPTTNHSPSSVSALRSMLSPSTPSPSSYEMMHPPSSMYKKSESSHRNSHNRHKTSNLAVFNPDPNGIRQKIVIKNMDPRPSHHSHHHRRL